jgi:hypothetical protein
MGVMVVGVEPGYQSIETISGKEIDYDTRFTSRIALFSFGNYRIGYCGKPLDLNRVFRPWQPAQKSLLRTLRLIEASNSKPLQGIALMSSIKNGAFRLSVVSTLSNGFLSYRNSIFIMYSAVWHLKLK